MKTTTYTILAENQASGYVRTLATIHHPKTIEEAREIAGRHHDTRPNDVITFHPVNGGNAITYNTCRKEPGTMNTTTTNTIKFDTVANMIHRYERATHGYYFSNDTTRFFSAKYYEPVYKVGGTEVFVDSIRDTYGNQPRQYRVQVWDGADSAIGTVAEYKTLRSAEKAARRHAEALANQ